MPSTNFQGQVTNAINTVGILAGLTGVPQVRKEQKALEGTLKAAGEKKKEITKKLDDETLPKTERVALERTIEYLNDQVERHSERIAELRPSAKNIQNVMNAYASTAHNQARIDQTRENHANYHADKEAWEETNRLYQEAEAARREEEAMAIGEFGTPRYDESRAQQANERSQKQAKARQARRNFVRDYLPKIETGFGGTVGDFSKETQRKLGKNYSTKERKEIMDRMDNEKKNKGGKV